MVVIITCGMGMSHGRYKWYIHSKDNNEKGGKTSMLCVRIKISPPYIGNDDYFNRPNYVWFCTDYPMEFVSLEKRMRNPVQQLLNHLEKGWFHITSENLSPGFSKFGM
jgi:hypothetical protein